MSKRLKDKFSWKFCLLLDAGQCFSEPYAFHQRLWSIDFLNVFLETEKKHDLSGFSCARLFFSLYLYFFYKTNCLINFEILQLRHQKKFEISVQVHIKNSRFLTQISGSKTALHNLQRRWIWLRRCIKVWRQIGQGPFISIFHSGGF